MKLASGVIQLERGEVLVTNRAAVLLGSLEFNLLELGKDIVPVQLKEGVIFRGSRRTISGLNLLFDGLRRIFNGYKVVP